MRKNPKIKLPRKRKKKYISLRGRREYQVKTWLKNILSNDGKSKKHGERYYEYKFVAPPGCGIEEFYRCAVITKRY